MDVKKVIVLDCHLRSQEGVLKSLHERGYFVVGLSWDKSCAGFSSRYIDKKVISPRLEDGTSTYVEFLLSHEDRGVLLFSNDLSSLTVARHAEVLAAAGYDFLIPELDKLESAFDKWGSYNLASAAGVKAPKSILVSTLAEALAAWPELKKPVILKATRLAGGNYIKMRSQDELERAWEKMEGLTAENQEHESQVILQEWLEYGITDMWSCETVYDRDSKTSGFYSIQRVRSSLDRATGNFTSRLFAGEYKKNPKLEATTKRLLDHIGWQGIAHVEYMYQADEDEYYLAEINPRLPGYSYFPSAAGFEMGAIYTDFVLGQSAEFKDDFKPALYFESLRYPGDLSEGIYHLFKGNLGWSDFIKSYGRLFQRNTIKVVDPFRLSDLGFTFKSFINDIGALLSYAKGWIFRKVGIN